MTDAKRVPIWGKPQGYVTVEPGATVGAVFGVNLRWPNGSLVKLTDFEQTATETGGSQFSYWIQIADVPANVKGIAALTGTGVVRKTGDGAFDTATTTTDLPEGATNLYHTVERAQDAVGAAIAAGTGDGVTLTYDDAGNKIDATNTDKGSVAVAAHEAAPDPHPQYTTAAEAAAAAPVQSVNAKTGAVVLTASDVGADPTGTASSAIAAHVAAPDPHPQYALRGSTGSGGEILVTGEIGPVALTTNDETDWLYT